MNGDLISRSALLDSFRKRCLEDCEYCPFAILNPEKPEIVCGLIRKAPAVDAEPVRHGRWIYVKTYIELDECNCSECGQIVATYVGQRMNYCPNCGAKMQGGNDEA